MVSHNDSKKELPDRIFLEITTECNLKCRFCHLWKRKENNDILSPEDKLGFLKNFFVESKEKNKISNDCIQVTLTGGEPLTKPKDIFEISNLCKDNKVNCFINTNGTLLRGLEKHILTSGLTALTISIDSHKAEIHDKLRDIKGLFNHLIDEIGQLLKKKLDISSQTNICIQSVLGSWNINELRDQITFFKDLGVDGILFQPIQYPFGLMIPHDWYKNYRFFPRSEREVLENLDVLRHIKSQEDGSSFLLNSIEEIKLWRSYFKNPEVLETQKPPCGAHHQNLIVDIYGNVKFCFNKQIEPINHIGNIKTQTLDEILFGLNAQKIKKEMRECRKSCGVMACHIDQDFKEGVI